MQASRVLAFSNNVGRVGLNATVKLPSLTLTKNIREKLAWFRRLKGFSVWLYYMLVSRLLL